MKESKDQTAFDHEGERLQKVIARAGLGSRRVCEELIADGRVTVNGEIAELGRRVDTAKDLVEVDDTPLPINPGLVHYLLNKPAGVITTADDPQGRKTVLDLLPAEPRVFPVGRLDQDTEGLLVVTNDGDLTYRLTHPKYGVEKEYLAHVAGEPKRSAIRSLREGVELEDGMTAPAQASLVTPNLIRIVIHEGRNRQVRRMCEAIGHPVERLVRVRIGPLADRKLKPGAHRLLTTDEIMALERAALAETDPKTANAPKPPKRENRSRAVRSQQRHDEREAEFAEKRAVKRAAKKAASTTAAKGGAKRVATRGSSGGSAGASRAPAGRSGPPRQAK